MLLLLLLLLLVLVECQLSSQWTVMGAGALKINDDRQTRGRLESLTEH